MEMCSAEMECRMVGTPSTLWHRIISDRLILLA
ncbi:unnamed protein product [Anisakis simplex]|uniref:Uncharacterized protein n=1 Tax=Anisakis simplex TaxID=6269 RepID=A0A3P6P3G5_ANISI|nr:unnamed protein product [Anisakis simplex]